MQTVRSTCLPDRPWLVRTVHVCPERTALYQADTAAGGWRGRPLVREAQAKRALVRRALVRGTEVRRAEARRTKIRGAVAMIAEDRRAQAKHESTSWENTSTGDQSRAGWIGVVM